MTRPWMGAVPLLLLGAGWGWEAFNLWQGREPWPWKAGLALSALALAVRLWRGGRSRG